jgi:hypothetical protein
VLQSDLAYRDIVTVGDVLSFITTALACAKRPPDFRRHQISRLVTGATMKQNSSNNLLTPASRLQMVSRQRSGGFLAARI